MESEVSEVLSPEEMRRLLGDVLEHAERLGVQLFRDGEFYRVGEWWLAFLDVYKALKTEPVLALHEQRRDDLEALKRYFIHYDAHDHERLLSA